MEKMDLPCWQSRTMGGYGRNQVFGHVDAGHCYDSRPNHDRRGISEDGRYKAIGEVNKPGNIDIYMAQEIR